MIYKKKPQQRAPDQLEPRVETQHMALHIMKALNSQRRNRKRIIPVETTKR